MPNICFPTARPQWFESLSVGRYAEVTTRKVRLPLTRLRSSSLGHQSWARLDNFIDDRAYVFPRFDRQISARSVDEVVDALAEVEGASERGQWAMGYVAYDAAPGLDPDLAVMTPAEGRAGGGYLPLVWFGISDAAPHATDLIRSSGHYQATGWCHEWEPQDYERTFDEVKSAIAAGETYQCNLTTALTASFLGDAESFYADLSRAQQGKYSAYIDLGSDVIASASPELFFEWAGDQLLTRPMKGTAPRGMTPEQDALQLKRLRNSDKERAENIIVVDLLRNDLSRIAVAGTVQVPALLTAEPYETVWQLTSDVTARVAPDTGFVDILRALFPCGSVTGAPKIATMDIIRRVETRRRGIYCGCIGVLAPKQYRLRAQFNVAIRTARIDRLLGECEYGVGSGVTWGSNCWAEYAELETKCAILPNRPRRLTPFDNDLGVAAHSTAAAPSTVGTL